MTTGKTNCNLEDLTGRWKVKGDSVEDWQGATSTSKELTGLVLIVEAQGNVRWEVPSGAPAAVPLFKTSSAFLHKNTLTFLDGEGGWSVSFTVKGEPERGWIVLESEEEGVDLLLSFAKMESCIVSLEDDYFSLKEALDQSLFTDISFMCEDGKEVKSHRAVLAAAFPLMEEEDWTIVFKARTEDLGMMLLSCIYSDSIPDEMDIDRAKKIIDWLRQYPKLERLTKHISAFIESNTLKQKLMKYIDEILTLLQEAKVMVSSMDMADSVKVRYTIKQLARDLVLGGAKLGVLCNVYTRERKEVGRAEWREVLDHLRFRIVSLLDFLREIAEEAVQKWEDLSREKQKEVATELIPEIEQLWDLFLHYGQSLSKSVKEELGAKQESGQGTTVAVMLRLLSHGSERKRLRKIRKELVESVEMAQNKREWWDGRREEEKAEQVLNVIGKLVNEIEDVQESLETRKRHLLLENGLEWKSFRSYVDIATMYMNWGLQKMLAVKQSLKQLLQDVLQFVGRSEVNETAKYLGLLEEEELEALQEDLVGEKTANVSSLLQSKSVMERGEENCLAQGCVQLSKSGKFADMEFVVGTVVIPAHRVIVAARSRWASQALQSGMREAREKRIKVSDVEEQVFRLFINYLYGAHLTVGSMSTESIVELLAVADRFDNQSLLQLCEKQLISRIKDSTVFQLLTVVELCPSAHLLRETCLQHILQKPQVIVDEVGGFTSLTDLMQQEIRDLLSAQDPTLALRHSIPTQTGRTKTISSTSSSSRASSEDEECVELESGVEEWDKAIHVLQGILGSEVTSDVLRELLLMADMDINRAVNYFFNNMT